MSSFPPGRGIPYQGKLKGKRKGGGGERYRKKRKEERKIIRKKVPKIQAKEGERRKKNVRGVKKKSQRSAK
jgi:hypothetical protein